MKITDIQMCQVSPLTGGILAVWVAGSKMAAAPSHLHTHIRITWGVWTHPLHAFTPRARLN